MRALNVNNYCCLKTMDTEKDYCSIDLIKTLTAKAHRINFKKIRINNADLESLQKMKVLSLNHLFSNQQSLSTKNSRE